MWLFEGCSARITRSQLSRMKNSSQNGFGYQANIAAYHGTTMGALSITGVPGLRENFEPLFREAIKVRNTNHYRCVVCSNQASCTLDCADDIERKIIEAGPETVAMVILEPLQNTGGALVPPEGYWQRARQICDKYGILLVSDEVICAFGRLGHFFGADRFGYQPDMITFAKGVTSGYAPLGGVIASDRIAAPFIEEPTATCCVTSRCSKT